MPVDTLVELTAEERVVPLPRPLQLGPMRISQRHYTILSVRCASGISGCAFAQTRGAPIVEVVERLLAPAVLGKDAESLRQCWEDAYRATVAVGRTGLVMRALSLLDLALWDARGKRAASPVWRLLGGEGVAVPVIYVAGYPSEAADLDNVCRRAVDAGHRGHATIKLARTPTDPELTRSALRRLDADLPAGTRVAVDCNWGYASVDQALREVDRWPASRVAWVEDPFPPEEVRTTADFRRRAPIAVGVGDDLTDRVHAARLLEEEAVDVLRLDVAAIGGISEALPLVSRARAADVPVSFHISPEASIHLATLDPSTSCVETFDRSGNALDPSHELVAGGPKFARGHAVPATTPGLGFEIAEARA